MGEVDTGRTISFIDCISEKAEGEVWWLLGKKFWADQRWIWIWKSFKVSKLAFVYGIGSDICKVSCMFLRSILLLLSNHCNSQNLFNRGWSNSHRYKSFEQGCILMECI